MEIPATLNPCHSYPLTIIFKFSLPRSLHADSSNSFIPCTHGFNLDNMCRLCIQRPFPTGQIFFKNRIVMNNISKQECVLCPALGFSPNPHCRKLTYFLQMSFTYQSSHAGWWIRGNANFPHSGSLYKLLQKFTIDALLDKDSAGTEADFTLPRMTHEDNDKTHSFMGRSPCISDHLPDRCQALV